MYPSIPIAHSVQIKEDRESVKILLELIQYNDHDWDVYGDFKMITFLLRLQVGFTKHSCFLCWWNNRVDEQHYFVKNWPACKDLTPDSHNVLNSLKGAKFYLLHCILNWDWPNSLLRL